jgi:hypothetical protein
LISEQLKRSRNYAITDRRLRQRLPKSSSRTSPHPTQFSTGEALGYAAKIRQHIAKLEKFIESPKEVLTGQDANGIMLAVQIRDDNGIPTLIKLAS